MTEPPARVRSSTPLVAVVVAILVVLFGSCRARLCGSVPTVAGQKAEKQEAAVRMRASAKLACGHRNYRECLGIYDEARHFDPEGDLQPDVQDARLEAMRALEARADPANADGAPPASAPSN